MPAMIISHSAAETFALGKEHAGALQAGDVVALCGDLAAGKTHFIKGLAAGWGIEVEVTSPTFTLVHEYTGGRLPFFHMDFYRLDFAEEALGIGVDEYFSSGGITAVEWADKFPELIPKGATWIYFVHGTDGAESRELRFLSHPNDRAGD